MQNKQTNGSENDLGNRDESFYERMEKGGLNYIKHQDRYVIISGIYPIYCLCILVMDFILVLLWAMEHLEVLETKPGPGDVFAPVPGVLFFTIFFLLKFVHLLRWRRKLGLYEAQKKKYEDTQSRDLEDENGDENVSLAKIFYDIINHMEKIRKIFLFVNFVLLFSIIWSLLFFLFQFFSMGPPPECDKPDIPLAFLIFPILNFIMGPAFPFYLFYEWKHFRRWNKKLKRLKKLEKEISEELNL